MSGKSSLSSSLSVRQAAKGLTVALLLGLVLTALEMGWSVIRERGKAERLGNEIMDLLDGSAAVAVWNFDPDLGRRVVQDALTLDAVQGFELVYRSKEVLASAHRDKLHVSVLGGIVFGDLTVIERPLYRPQVSGTSGVNQAAPEQIGAMRIFFDLSVISEDLWAFLINALLGGLVRNLLLGLALTLVFNRSLTRPLTNLARSIDVIDPTRPEASHIDVPKGHETDELGAIAARVNEMMGRLARVQADLRRLSTRDPLTKLANRALFEEGMAAALVRTQRSGRGLAVMSVLMKPEAVSQGGDQALLQVANRLRDCVRSADLLARLGPDEFVAVLGDVDATGVMRLADRVVSGLAHGLPIADRRIDNTPLIGIALYPEDGTDAESLATAARAAANRAAAENTTVLFATSSIIEVARENLALAEAIMSALEEDRVTVAYQPLIEVASGRPVALIAIPSWRHRDAVLAGSLLISAAAEIGLDVAVVDHVLRTVIRDVGQKRPGLPVVVRCAPRQLADHEFPHVIRSAREEAGLDSGSLVLLIPQDFGSNNERLATLSALHRAGIELWLDVARPAEIPLGILIDPIFTAMEIAAPTGSSDVPEQARAILALAAERGIPVGARAVESSAQWASLVRSGCKRLRGPVISAPVSMAQLSNQLAGLEGNLRDLGGGGSP